MNKKELPQQCKESIIVPIYKRGYKGDCSIYRGISLLSITYTILSNILLPRFSSQAEEISGDRQCRFEIKGQLLILLCTCQILEKEWEYSAAVHKLFIDTKKA